MKYIILVIITIEICFDFVYSKTFSKWSKSNCVIKDHIKSIPKMPYYSWTKESRTNTV